MHVCPYTSVWLLVISVCVYCKLLQSLSRSRQCEGKACCFCPQTLVGARRFHSPCRRCAGSAGAHKGKLSKHHLCMHTPHFHHSQRSFNLSLGANWNSVAHYLRVYLLVICLKKQNKIVRKRLVKKFSDAVTHTLAQLTDEEGAQCGFLVVILNVYIDYMHGLQRLLLSGIQI